MQAQTAGRTATLPLEVRWHGRGGQGAVTASRLLASAALAAGLYPQSLPDFGAERSGAPVAAHTRIDSQPPVMRGPVEEPSVVVVLDPTLIGQVDVTAGLQEGGAVVINTRHSPEEMRGAVGRNDVVICTVDGSGIATRLLGRDLPNSAVLGAVLSVEPVVDLGVAARALREQMSETFTESVVEANASALYEGHHTAQVSEEA